MKLAGEVALPMLQAAVDAHLAGKDFQPMVADIRSHGFKTLARPYQAHTLLWLKQAYAALDEATQGLDQPGSAAFYRQIEEVRRDMGCAVLMVSHDLHVVMAASDRVLCLNGHVCCEGRPEIVAQAEEYRAIFGSGTSNSSGADHEGGSGV